MVSLLGISASTLGRVVTDRLCRYKNYEANYPKSKDEPSTAIPIKDLPSLPSDADAVSETTYSAMSSVAEIVAGKIPSCAREKVVHAILDS